jgi:prophage DNA circulation protein
MARVPLPLPFRNIDPFSVDLEAAVAQVRRDQRNPHWRRRLRQASFKGVPFYVDQQGQSSGRRTVTHEYPKRDLPYAEDMGRAAYRYQMTGYLIQTGDPREPLTPRHNGMVNDYSINRDNLRAALDSLGPGVLQDPYNPALNHLGYGGYALLFMCERYTLSESRERGGYCAIEMSFVEAGHPVISTTTDTAAAIEQQTQSAKEEATRQLNETLKAATGALTLPF